MIDHDITVILLLGTGSLLTTGINPKVELNVVIHLVINQAIDET